MVLIVNCLQAGLPDAAQSHTERDGGSAVDPKRWPNVAIAVLLCIALSAVALDGCASVTARSADQPPVVSEYRGWTISVTPSSVQDLWRARVRVWPPEVRPETHSGINVSFSGAAADRTTVEQAATATARRYIDASLPVHQ